MKRIIVNGVLFGLLITFLCVLYVRLFQVSLSALGILLAVLAIYGFCMEIGWKSAHELKKYEQKAIHFGLCDEDDPKILLHALLSLSSTYFCVLLALLIPLYTYEIWLITVLPCIILNCLPASSVLDEYYCLTHKKFPFIASFSALVVVFCCGGALANFLVLNRFIQGI